VPFNNLLSGVVQ